MTTQRRGYQLPEPDFTDSRELRLWLNRYRTALHAAAMMTHQGAAEMEAALSTIDPKVDGGFVAQAVSRSMRHRRARRVTRHMKHAAECLIEASSASVRCWGAFRREYAPELSPVRGPRPRFTVVPE